MNILKAFIVVRVVDMKKIKLKLNKIKFSIMQNIVELILLFGLFFIVQASFLINLILGLYILGLILIGLAVFMFKFPQK